MFCQLQKGEEIQKLKEERDRRREEILSELDIYRVLLVKVMGDSKNKKVLKEFLEHRKKLKLKFQRIKTIDKQIEEARRR